MAAASRHTISFDRILEQVREEAVRMDREQAAAGEKARRTGGGDAAVLDSLKTIMERMWYFLRAFLAWCARMLGYGVAGGENLTDAQRSGQEPVQMDLIPNGEAATLPGAQALGQRFAQAADVVDVTDKNERAVPLLPLSHIDAEAGQEDTPDSPAGPAAPVVDIETAKGVLYSEAQRFLDHLRELELSMLPVDSVQAAGEHLETLLQRHVYYEAIAKQMQESLTQSIEAKAKLLDVSPEVLQRQVEGANVLPASLLLGPSLHDLKAQKEAIEKFGFAANRCKGIADALVDCLRTRLQEGIAMKTPSETPGASAASAYTASDIDALQGKYATLFDVAGQKPMASDEAPLQGVDKSSSQTPIIAQNTVRQTVYPRSNSKAIAELSEDAMDKADESALLNGDSYQVRDDGSVHKNAERGSDWRQQIRAARGEAGLGEKHEANSRQIVRQM